MHYIGKSHEEGKKKKKGNMFTMQGFNFMPEIGSTITDPAREGVGYLLDTLYIDWKQIVHKIVGKAWNIYEYIMI